MALRDQSPKKKDGGARILSASVIGAAALGIVGAVAYVQMKQPDSVMGFTLENPSPPRDLAQTEAARAEAERRLAEAMAIQITNIPSAAPQPTAPAKAPTERVSPPNEQIARAEVTSTVPTAPAPLQQPVAPPAGMPASEQEALLGRVAGLLRQGDVGAARAVLNRLVRENNPKAAFVLAQSYDPNVLRQDGVVGLHGDADKARSLYEQALRGGVTEAKPALDTLQQATN